MDTQDVLAQYLAKAEACRIEAEDLQNRVKELRIREEDFLEAAEMLRPVLVEDEDDLSDVIADFTGCNSMLDRLVRVARAAEGRLLNTSKTAQFLLEHGQSKSTFQNYRTEVNRALANSPQHFQKVSAGTYRYIGALPTLDEAINGVREGDTVVIPSVLESLEGPNVGRYGHCEE